MKGKDAVVISFNVNWQAIVILGFAIGVLAVAYSGVLAQGGDSPTTNTVEIEAPASEAALSPDTLPVPAEPDCANGELPTTNGECVPAEAINAARLPATGEAGLAAAGSGRHFYLTDQNYATDRVLGACASGYHMASLWEILDVSNLTYDYDHPDAHTKSDSGYGPPSFWHGWVHTGNSSSGSATTGTGNCLDWTTASGTYYGVSVRLSRTWETAPGDIFTWDANTFACGITGPVWCVGD